jgi:hypothetical protein
MAQQPQVNVTVNRDGPAPPAPANPAHARAQRGNSGPAPAPDDFPQANAQPPPAPEPPPPPAPTGPVKIEVPLRRPIMAHDGERKVLVLREPTVLDIERFGLPVTLEFAGGAKPVFDPVRMTQMLALLANVTDREIRSLDPRDYTSACWAVAPFFVPDFRVL